MSGALSLLTHPAQAGEAGAAAAWLVANFIAVTRRPVSAVRWYQVAGAVEGGLAIGWGLESHAAAWWALGVLWVVLKVGAVPRWLLAGLPRDQWELAAPGTPRLLLGSAVLLVVGLFAAGPPGAAVGAVVTPFWLMTQRRELWVAAVLLVEAEVALGFLALALAAPPALADVLDAGTLLWTAGLLAWLLRRAREDWPEPIHTTQLRRLRG